MQKRADTKPDDSLDHTDLQASLSLDMHSLSEHNKNTDQKNVKLSQAIKKADLPAMKSFNEHLENACSREPVPIFA